MARIYVTEPGTTGGVGAMGMRLLIESLRDAGHDVTRVALWKQIKGGEQLSLISGATDKLTSTSHMRKPDAWFVSMLYVRQWIDVPDMFRRMGLAARREDRKPTDPLVAFGGQSMIAPAPVEAFADVLAMGDGEATAAPLAAMSIRGREWVMGDLEDRDGYYVPGRSRILRRAEAPAGYTPRMIQDEDGRGAPTIEVARGCKSKCSFCPIGWAGGTYREADPAAIRSQLVKLRGKRVNLFAPDYSTVTAATEYEGWLASFGCSNAGRDARLDAAARHLDASVGVKEYSFGLEGLSERMRRAIGKPLSRERIVDMMSRLSTRGVRKVRWYMILGLPGETDADLDEFLAMSRDVRDVSGDMLLDVTCTHLQAVPHTPLQWIANAYDDGARGRWSRMRDTFREWHKVDAKSLVASEFKGRELHEHDAWLQRAPREASEYLLRLDSRKVRTTDERWREDVSAVGLDVSTGLGEIATDAVMPWDHVDVGVPRDKVLQGWRNYQAALARTQVEGAELSTVFANAEARIKAARS
jgi:radical SAM superfamily enzyme YgiQ (UPF0313 family)